MGLWGCAGLTGSDISPEQAGQQVESARTLLETVKSLPPEKLPPEELVQATDSFERAENVLRSGDPEGAVRSAEESTAISRRILGHFYSTTIAELARRAGQELSRKKAVEPDHPLTDRISRMEQIAVITSYSIHYTKLYDSSLPPLSPAMTGGISATGSPASAIFTALAAAVFGGLPGFFRRIV